MSGIFRIASLALAAGMLVFATGCGEKEERRSTSPRDSAGAASSQPAPIPVPTSASDVEWRDYVGRMIGRHIKRRSLPPFAFYVPPEGDELEEQISNMRNTLLRPIARDTTLGFGSRDSAVLAERLVEVFEPVPEDALKGVRVVFVGNESDRAAAEEAVRPSGAEFVFAEIGS